MSQNFAMPGPVTINLVSILGHRQQQLGGFNTLCAIARPLPIAIGSGSDPLNTAMDRMKKVKKCLQPPAIRWLNGLFMFIEILLPFTILLYIQWK